MKNNIILIGMPSCGKSTVGVLLAKRLGFGFIDSDLLIQERERRLLHEIIADEGIEGFKRIENEVNLSITAERTVISTGGSVVYCEPAMEHLRELGKVVYLKISFETLSRRLGDYTHRGVVLPEGYSLRRLYDERCLLYERYADITLEEADLDIGSTLEAVVSLLDIEN